MKLKNVCRFLFLFLLMLFLTSCFEKENKETELVKQQKEIYQLAVEVGYDGTFEEWLGSIKGEQGVPGKDGKKVELNVKDGFISWQNEGDTSWYNLVSLETLMGSKGLDGKEIELSVSETHIQWRYIGEEEYQNLIELSIIKGETGKGIKGTEISNLGELIIIYTDESTQNLGKILKSFLVQFVDYNGYIINIQQVTYSKDATSPQAPTRLGYEFDGWDKEFSNIQSDLVVNAKYNTNKYTISFDSDLGSKIDSIVGNYGTYLQLPTPEIEDYDFLGWYSINGTHYTNDNKLEKDLVLYAKWSLKTYKVTFVDAKNAPLYVQEVKYGYSALNPKNPVKEGYAFTGWETNFIEVTSDLTIKPLFKPEIYRIVFYENGGSYVDDIEIEYAELLPELPKPSYNGRIFIGWYTEKELINKFTDNTVPLYGIVLYAKWEPIQYRIDFDTDGGEYIDSLFVPYGDILYDLPTPIKTGFKFLWWEYQGMVVDTPTFFYYNQNITFKARWDASPNLGGYTIRIAQSEQAIEDIDPFHSDYSAPDKIAKQHAWNWVEEFYNCNIEVAPYPTDDEWGEPRWTYIEQQAASNTADYDFYTVPDAQIGRFVEANALIDVTGWYAAYGNGYMDAVYKSSGTYQNNLYSITDGKSGIYNVMYYNIGLLEQLELEKSPAQIFNEGDWTYSAFKNYAITAQAKLDMLSTIENPYYAISGCSPFYWVGMSNAGGVKLANVNTIQMDIENPISVEAADTLKAIKAANAMDPIKQLDEKVTSWNSGRALFNTGDLWFVNHDLRWNENLWGEGDFTRYGYVPFPRPDGTLKEDQTIGLSGTTTWVMPIGRDYDSYGYDCTPENIYRAIVSIFQKTDEFLKSSLDYDEDLLLRERAEKYTDSEDSIEAFIYMSKRIKTHGFFDPLSSPTNPIVNTGYGTFSTAVNVYIMGFIDTFSEAVATEIASLQEKLCRAYG